MYSSNLEHTLASPWKLLLHKLGVEKKWCLLSMHLEEAFVRTTRTHAQGQEQPKEYPHACCYISVTVAWALWDSQGILQLEPV